MHYDYVPMPARKPLKWPNGKRLALMLCLNLEYWDLTKDTEEPYYAGGPPILLGVLEGTRQFGRVVEYCDGWVPIAPAVYTSYGEDALRTGRQQMDKMRDGIRRLREAAEQAGRSSNEINLTAYAVGGGSSPETEGLLPGAEDEARELIDMGFQRLVFILPPRKEELLLPVMDDYAELAAKVG